MIDQNERLRAILKELDEELKRTQPVNDNQRQHLEALQRDVQALLDRPGEVSPAADPSTVEGLTAGLRHFEATHPALTSLVEQALATLSNLGF